MALNTKNIPSNNNSNRVEQPVLEAGVYPARLVQIIDMGLQPQRPYKGQEKPPAYEINTTYELVDAFMVNEDGEELLDKPRWVSESYPIYSLEADMAKSTKRYLALDPEQVHEGNFGDLADTPCNVTIVINKAEGKTYTNIAGVAAMRPRDAAKCPPLVNDIRVFDLEKPDLEVFNKLPKWMQDKITSNLEFKGSPLEEALAGSPQDEGEKKAPAKKPARKATPVEKEEETDTPAWEDENQEDDSPY